MDTERDPLRKIPTKHAPDVKVDIGTSLKAARSKKGHSLEAVSQQTRIPRKFLEALEENRFDEFPALAYLGGFLKSYCDHLEVDFEPLWRRISEVASQAAAPPTPSSSTPAQPPASAAGGLIAAGIVSIGIGMFFFWHPSSRATRNEHQAPSATTPAALAPLKSASEPLITLLFRHEMWVSISIDGMQKFEGRVPQGSKQEWKAKRTIILRASDPQALKVSLNGEPFTLPAPDSTGSFVIEAP